MSRRTRGPDAAVTAKAKKLRCAVYTHIAPS